MNAPASSVMSPNSAVRVIVVEDNTILLEELVFHLGSAGFCVRGASDGIQMDALLEKENAEIVVLDVNLPFESGHKIAQRLRSTGTLGVIMLTGRSQLDDKLQGLANGADVYLTKPAHMSELIAYINGLWRRIKPLAAEAPWQLNTNTRQLISPNAKKLSLAPQEVKILQLLHGIPSKIVSRKQIIETLDIEYHSEPDARINMMISRLRHKLFYFDSSLIIQTWRNEGYSYTGPELN